MSVDILPTLMNSIGHTNVASTAPAMQPLAMAVTGFFDFFAMLPLSVITAYRYGMYLDLLLAVVGNVDSSPGERGPNPSINLRRHVNG